MIPPPKQIELGFLYLKTRQTKFPTYPKRSYRKNSLGFFFSIFTSPIRIFNKTAEVWDSQRIFGVKKVDIKKVTFYARMEETRWFSPENRRVG